MSYKSILFFIILFGIIILGYFTYETWMAKFHIGTIVKVILVLLGMLSIAFPHVMDYLKYSDEKYSLEDVLVYHHSNQKK